MTHEELQSKIKNLLENLDENKYPQLAETLKYYADIDDVDEWIYEITQDIFNADQTNVLPENVSEFMISLYTEMINDGFADAACDLGSLYYKGRFGKVDFKKAVHYYTLAADGGCRQAQENLGYCYYYGRDVEIDYKKAFNYFALGAFDGHLNSLYKVGDMYRNGYYVDKSPVEAYRIYKRCLETLTEEALPLVGADIMLRMGDCYYEGIGIEPDWNEAYNFYFRAETLYYDRLKDGDYLIKGCYKKAIERQAQIRNKRNIELPDFNWVK